MPLSAGDKLGPYEILGPLGAGGMGQVYRARDTRLARDVAIKVSNEEFSDRFDREARSIAALNHLNICQLYDVGPDYLVMELIDGAPLKGPLPLEKALDYARQIADALESAHERNIVHRDLKPGNILITSGGVIKVLDFSLAKNTEAPASDPENSPTMTISPTRAGMILGTAAYMSPEQARGKSVDKRADIWAFGVVLYEMLTGNRPFRGETVSDILAAVLKSEPDLSVIPVQAHRLVKGCLQKDPRDRLRDIADAKFLLEPSAPIATRSSPRHWYMAALIVALSIAVSAAFLALRPQPKAGVLSSALVAPEGATFEFTNGLGLPALSPDGTRIAYGARSADGKAPLWVRSLSASAAQPLPGTDGAAFPFWSPDSRSIGFFADGKLRRIEAAGGPALTLADAPNGRGASWSSLGVIIFTPSNGIGVGLHRIPATGGGDSQVAEAGSRLPWFLPDGRHFLYQLQTQSTDRVVSIRLGSINGGPGKNLFQASSNAVYSQGQILFLRDKRLLAQPFDLRRLELSGEPRPMVEGIQSVLNSRTAGVFTVSENGLLAYRKGDAGRPVVTMLDRRGAEISTFGDPIELSRGFELSPDGKMIAMGSVENSNVDVWALDLTRNLRRRLTFDPAGDRDPLWSPDQLDIVFASNRRGHADLYQKIVNGSGEDKLLYADPSDKWPTSWSPDGKIVLYSAPNGKESFAIWGLPIAPERPGSPRNPFVVVPRFGGFGQFSPDGRWIAYISSESGTNELMIIPYPLGAGKWLVAQAALGQPRWRKDGREIFFVSRDRRLMSADLTFKSESIEVGRARALFGPIDEEQFVEFGVTGDGQHFFLPLAVNQRTSEPLTLLQNWPATLKQ